MAEILGAVSAALGIVAFALQVGSTVETLRDLRKLTSGDALKDLEAISEMFDSLQETLTFLHQTPIHKVDDDGQRLLKAKLRQCSEKCARVDEELSQLRQRSLKATLGRKQKWNRFKLATGRFKEQVQDIRHNVTEMNSGLVLWVILLFMSYRES
ncbi:hypothetical protein NKR23_g6168 [Pleurostoma richardsiae]|uniref:Azaphilone pigments biosynthesis cluster protein L N-terminal domain-containing protein n=1 Tax=Pleurostoma richardsiae TaxID=41990 RepID=A0AA38VEE6_9PEZI|nr:hypothetical protein NKR23_g6168 [Pleurostoma richardsiae]